jgi:hypothetical protein
LFGATASMGESERLTHASNKQYSLFHGTHTSTGWDCHQDFKNYVNGDCLYITELYVFHPTVLSNTIRGVAEKQCD